MVAVMSVHRLRCRPNITATSNHEHTYMHSAQSDHLIFYIDYFMYKTPWKPHYSVGPPRTQYIESMLVYRWSTVYDVGPTVNQH